MATATSCVAGPARSTKPRRKPLVENDVAEIVHDIRNPLGAIALEMMLLDERFGESDRDETSRSVRRIQHNIEYIDRLVSDLLDVCAIAAGHFELHCAKTDLRVLLEQVIDRLSPAARRRVMLDAAFGPELAVDDVRIQRVVANLLDNALKYSPANAVVVVKLRLDEHSAYISVTDTGPGVAAADVEHLFERYHRVAAVQPRGYGIGLYTAKKIVDAHGGTIGVDTILGLGSRFFFALPVC